MEYEEFQSEDQVEFQGFDRQAEFDWYEENKIQCLAPLGYCLEKYYEKMKNNAVHPVINSTNNHVKHKAQIYLDQDEMNALLTALYPKRARNRSIFDSVFSSGKSWLRKDSPQFDPIPTNDRNLSYHPFAVISGSGGCNIDPEAREKGEKRLLHYIVLHTLDDIPYDGNVRKIIHQKALIHEYGHTLINPLIHWQDYALVLHDGEVVDGVEFLLRFARIALKYPSISPYAAIFRGKDNKFLGHNALEVLESISEELTESLTAFLLNFCYTGDGPKKGETVFKPLNDRKEVEQYVFKFLGATSFNHPTKLRFSELIVGKGINPAPHSDVDPGEKDNGDQPPPVSSV